MPRAITSDVTHAINPKYHNKPCFGASLSEPHTSETALQDACVCMSACGHTPKILIERTDTEGHVPFKFAHMLVNGY